MDALLTLLLTNTEGKSNIVIHIGFYLLFTLVLFLCNIEVILFTFGLDVLYTIFQLSKIYFRSTHGLFVRLFGGCNTWYEKQTL